MTEMYIPKNKIDDAVQEMMAQHKVFAPVLQGRFHDFAPLSSPEEVDWECRNTRLSPKGLFHRHSERMFDYSLSKDDPEAGILKESPKDFSPRVVLNIRPCDARALQLVDVNFDTPEYRDPWWVKRREATTLVGLACNDPCSTCFCGSVGTGPFDAAGVDVLLVDAGEGYVARACTDKGEGLLAEIASGEPVTAEIREKVEALKKQAETSMADLHLNLDLIAEKDMKELFNEEFWEDVHFSCINCGTCTFLCPTCWCFDIQDEVYEGKGMRLRNWDSCMYPLFTLHASGHNPRDQKLQRVRQRFMHKFKYYLDKYETATPACVGCGRCVQHCPVNIDIREVVRRMAASCVCPA